jgi:hypothetical protein
LPSVSISTMPMHSCVLLQARLGSPHSPSYSTIKGRVEYLIGDMIKY